MILLITRLSFPERSVYCPSGGKKKKVQQIDYHGIILIADGVGGNLFCLATGGGQGGGGRSLFIFQFCCFGFC